jgi:hypothetical protein
VEGKDTMSDADVRDLIQSKISEGALHATKNTLFVFILKRGISVIFSDGSKSVDRFSGYHDALIYQGIEVAYVVLPSPWDTPPWGEGRFASDEGRFDLFTASYSHELAEAVTDKIPGRGWVSEDGFENADLETGGLLTWDPPNCSRPFLVQAYYTNERGPTVGAWREKGVLREASPLESALGSFRMRVNQFDDAGVFGHQPRMARLWKYGVAVPGFKTPVYIDSEGNKYREEPIPENQPAPPYIWV